MSALHIKGFQKVILNYLLYTVCVPISKCLEIGIHGSIYVWSPFCLFSCANGQRCAKEKPAAKPVLQKSWVSSLLQWVPLCKGCYSSASQPSPPRLNLSSSFQGLSMLPNQDVNLHNSFHTERMFAYLLNILTNILGSLAFLLFSVTPSAVDN